jgi:hypothetical protein
MSSSIEITPERVASRITELHATIQDKRAELDQLIDELEWWESGRRFFGFDGAEEDEDEPVEDEQGAGQQSFIGNGSKKPTLREAIIRVMAEKAKTWQTEEVLTTLRKRGWISNAKNADQHARSKMGAMARNGELKRIRRGHYRLPPSNQPS